MGFINQLTTGGHPVADAKKTSVRWLIRLSPLDSHKNSTSIRPVTDRNMYSKNIVKPILVGGIPAPLKNMKVSWDDEIPNIYIWKNIIQPCSIVPVTTNQNITP